MPALGSASITAWARVDILFEAGPGMAVVAISVHRRRRHRVDRIHADQFVDIKDIAVGLVLGAGARPQQTLGLRALLREALPALIGDRFL